MNKSKLIQHINNLRDSIESQEERPDLSPKEKVEFTEEERIELNRAVIELNNITVCEELVEELVELVEDADNITKEELNPLVRDAVEEIDNFGILDKSDQTELIEAFDKIKDDISNNVYED